MKTRLGQWINPLRVYQRLTHLNEAEWKSLGLKALALLLAFTLYLIARQPMSDMRVAGVPVEFSGLRQGVEVLGDDAAHTVTLRLRGPHDLVRGLLPNQLSVVANLSNKEPGERVVLLRHKDVLRPDGVDVLQIEPASIKLRLDTTARKQVKVEPRYSGTPAEGVELYRLTATPATVEVEGPQSLLTPLTEVKTESVSLTGQRQNFAATVDLELPHPSLRLVKRAPVTLAFALGERRASRLFSNLPVQVSGPAGNARLLTKTVEVIVLGPRAAVEALRDSDLKVELDLTALAPNTDIARPRVRLPERLAAQIEIKSINPSEIKVKK